MTYNVICYDKMWFDMDCYDSDKINYVYNMMWCDMIWHANIIHGDKLW